MKTYPFLFIGLFFLLASCGNNPSQESTSDNEGEEQAQALPADHPLYTMPLNTKAEIEDWIAELVIQAESGEEIEKTAPKTVTVGDKIMEVIVTNPKGRVTIVEAAHPNWVEALEAFRYFTRDGELVVFEEVKKIEDGFEIDRIYYANNEMISANSRKGETMQEAMEAVPGEFVMEDDDIFDNYDQIQATSERIVAMFHGETPPK